MAGTKARLGANFPGASKGGLILPGALGFYGIRVSYILEIKYIIQCAGKGGRQKG